MGESGGGPAMAPLNVDRGDQERWMHFDNSVNAISFGFVATAILISMFLIMAIFERFLRPQTSLFASFTEGRRRSGGGLVDIETQRQRGTGKIDYPSPVMSVYAKGVSVLMPGNDVPTFIGHPAPRPCPCPCPPERMPWPSHQQISTTGCTSCPS